MKRTTAALWGIALIVFVASPQPATAQSASDAIALVVKAGRPLRVALDEGLTVKRVGQPITARVVEPVYAHDRMVIPAGAKVIGHVERLQSPSRLARAAAIASGDFSPKRQVVIQFDTLIADDGREMPIRTVVGPGIERVRRRTAKAPEQPEPEGVKARVAQAGREKVTDAIDQIKDRAREGLATIREPDKLQRAKEILVSRLPYHPQILRKGTTYDAGLTAPLTFQSSMPVALAPPDAKPAPESILDARLVTPLNSASSLRGARVEAITTRPVFSEDHRLILPEGAVVTGEVTVAKPAQKFHRNGKLRFLFERLQSEDYETTPLLASLHSVDIGQGDDVAVDEEGGTAATDSKTRFIAPALALLALRGSVDRDRPFDNDADDVGRTASVQQGNIGSRAVGGFMGLGLLGVGLSQVSHPVGIALAAIGAARTVYSNILGKGRDVSFPADTPIQIQLAPGSAADRR